MLEELNQLNQRLAAAQEQAARRNKLQKRVQQLEAEHSACAEQVRRLEADLSREEGDVQRLEGLTLTGLFLSVLGSKEERLQKERQEALAARLKYDEAVQRLHALDKELHQTRQQWQASHRSVEDYAGLLEDKEHLIARSGGQGAEELLRLGEEAQQLSWQLQQLEEARTAGLGAADALGQVIASLESARNWGTWDMLGGGMLATAAKHSRIDDAQSGAHLASLALAAFHRELKDVAMLTSVNAPQVDGFTRFADYFFDGLIADWVVQNKINASLESVSRARGQVGDLLYQLKSHISDTQAKLQALNQEREMFVQQYQG